MTYGEWIQLGVGIVLTLTFGGILWYAWEARKAANASMKMAQEVRKQRYNQFQPVLDIEPVILKGEVAAALAQRDALALMHGQLPEAMECLLRNTGGGPALNVEVYIETNGHQNERFPARKVGAVASTLTKEEQLFSSTSGTNVDERPSFYCATYHDIAKRPFMSKREILFADDRWAPLGPLEYYPPEEDTHDS